MNTELRERAILPVLIPIGAIIFTEIIVFSLSRVLLATGHFIAVGIALGQALLILVGATALASSRRIRTATIAGALSLFVIAVVAAGVVAYQHGPAYSKEAAAVSQPTVAISAKNVAFSTKTLKLTASGTELDFSNQDNQPHNIAIFPSANDLTTVLFRGEITQPGTTSKYSVGKIKPGTYYFHCDVHPQQMTGTVTVT